MENNNQTPNAKNDKVPFYFNDWFIVLMAAASMQTNAVTLVIAAILVVARNKKSKRIPITLYNEYLNYDDITLKYKDVVESIERKQSNANAKYDAETKEHDRKIESLKSEIKILEIEKKKTQQELANYEKEYIEKVSDTRNYDNITSAELKNEISMLGIEEKELIKNDNALLIKSAETKKIINSQAKQILRCFSAETENILSNLTMGNADTSRGKIIKTYETLNSIFAVDKIELSKPMLDLKLKEFNLIHNYQIKLQQEKEQQKEIKDRMVEEEKVRREIEREKLKIDKEEKQFKNEVSKLISYLQKTDNDIEKKLYLDKIQELEEKLNLLEKDKENVLQREQNTRAGFVYIISNIGSFGENVYKIGMTRRLEPMDRINELGSASVPFEFDVHAMIFSEDAPTLETTLHQHFRKYEVNKVNSRKEFFKVDIKEIEELVKENHNATVEFTLVAKAEQYRESLRLSTEETEAIASV